jgi:hypothetical protein
MLEMKYRFDTITSDFKCKHCHHYVSTDPLLSGVNNRNHCPYCLWSRHLDLYQSGDRLAACKAEMEPVGLTLKRTNKRYGRQQGELMLIHRCIECGGLSINRTAADDDAEAILAIFTASLKLDPHLKQQIEQQDIQLLTQEDAEIVRARLFGWEARPTLSPSFA